MLLGLLIKLTQAVELAAQPRNIRIFEDFHHWEALIRQAWQDHLDGTSPHVITLVTPSPPQLLQGVAAHIILTQNPTDDFCSSHISIQDSTHPAPGFTSQIVPTTRPFIFAALYPFPWIYRQMLACRRRSVLHSSLWCMATSIGNPIFWARWRWICASSQSPTSTCLSRSAIASTLDTSHHASRAPNTWAGGSHPWAAIRRCQSSVPRSTFSCCPFTHPIHSDLGWKPCTWTGARDF